MLPPDFQFSQSSLQDYADCERRFELRYLLGQSWPAVDVDPILDKERFMAQGATFHRMVQAHMMGLPSERLLRHPDNAPLRAWWEGWLAHGLDDLPVQRHTEKLLSIRLAGFPLLAKIDLLAIDPGERAVIVDWKTSRKRPSAAHLQARLQTRIYRYLMVRAASPLNEGLSLAPEQVEMRYWFTEFPTEPQRLLYSEEQFRADEGYLEGLIEGIRAQQSFPLTEDTRQCRFCVYRSLCERGERAGDFDDMMALDDDDSAPPLMDLEF